MTQRELSSSLGISLGKVNFLIKSLIDKGFVKAKNFKNANNKYAYLYFLTPQGLEEKNEDHLSLSEKEDGRIRTT